MSHSKIHCVLIDTSYLRKAGFQHPDLQKLFRFSRDGLLKIFIPHIVWEERRTQLRDEVYANMRDLIKAFEKMTVHATRNAIFSGLLPPTLTMCTESEIDTNSKKAMMALATENKIEIVAMAPDHADRAWERYFKAEPPFNPDQPREQRRKDIPDSWIFETAIDLAKNHRGLFALCGDGKLSTALKSIPVTVFEDAQEVLREIEALPEVVRDAAANREAALGRSEETAAIKENELNLFLSGMERQFKDLDRKILGYVAYLGTASKEQLFSLLSRSGVSIEIARNVAERLAIVGVIKDTGNHYLPGNKEAGELAANLVENEIIKLLET